MNVEKSMLEKTIKKYPTPCCATVATKPVPSPSPDKSLFICTVCPTYVLNGFPVIYSNPVEAVVATCNISPSTAPFMA